MLFNKHGPTYLLSVFVSITAQFEMATSLSVSVSLSLRDKGLLLCLCIQPLVPFPP